MTNPERYFKPRIPNHPYIAWSEEWPGAYEGLGSRTGVVTRTWLGAWWRCYWLNLFTGRATWIERNGV